MSEDINIGMLSEAINDKADRDLNNTQPLARTVIEVSDKSILPSWYRIYSDGWCEQGGIIVDLPASSSAPANITFIKKMANNTYSTIPNIIGNQSYVSASIMNITTDGMQIYNRTNGTVSIQWQVKGYLADGQY